MQDMDNMLRAKEQEAMENDREIQRLNQETHSMMQQQRTEQDKLSALNQRIVDTDLKFKELTDKYTNVKKGYHLLKEHNKKYKSEFESADKKLQQMIGFYDPLKDSHEKLKTEVVEKSKQVKQWGKKLKDMKDKRDKDIASCDEKIKEQDKMIAGFTKATEIFDVQRKKADDREKQLMEDRSTQEANFKAMLERMEKLDTTANVNDSSSLDKSAMFDQMQNIQALLDPETQTVTLINMGGGDNQKAFKMKTKIRLINPDASVLHDTSQLDSSYIDGNIFDYNNTSQMQSTSYIEEHKRQPVVPVKNIFGAGGPSSMSASPSSP